jgi:trypsin
MHILPFTSLLLAIAGSANAIVGGDEATKDQAPFTVALSGNSLFCAGSLIGEKSVITAASCVEDKNATSIKVRLGSLHHASGGTVIGVSSIAIHPKYDADELDNDIAFITLADTYSDATPAQLPTNSKTLAYGSSVQIFGWGTTSEGGSLSSTLRTTSVKTISRATCQNTYGSLASITSREFCAGGNGKGTGQADQGGPVVDSAGTLVGVISRINRYGANNYPGVDIQVAAYLDWINSKLA